MAWALGNQTSLVHPIEYSIEFNPYVSLCRCDNRVPEIHNVSLLRNYCLDHAGSSAQTTPSAITLGKTSHVRCTSCTIYYKQGTSSDDRKIFGSRSERCFPEKK